MKENINAILPYEKQINKFKDIQIILSKGTNILLFIISLFLGFQIARVGFISAAPLFIPLALLIAGYFILDNKIQKKIDNLEKNGMSDYLMNNNTKEINK